MMTTTTPRIYVASLSDYNAGILHGRWIDADQDAEDIWAEVQEMLAQSTEPIAEEWAIHDYEGFGSLRLSEYETFERVATIGQALAGLDDETADALAAWLGLEDSNAVEDFEDHYRGHWDSWKDYVMESELGDIVVGLSSLSGLLSNVYDNREKRHYAEIIENLGGYIDWDQVARTIECDGGYSVVECGSPHWGVWVFEDDV